MDISKISHQYNHSHIDTTVLDKIVEYAKKELTESIKTYQLYQDSLAPKDQEQIPKQMKVVMQHDNALFQILCLSIVHCYSILEGNRGRLLSKLASNKQKDFHKIETVKAVIEKELGLKHENLIQSSVAEEFREVNNAIKHNRYNYSKEAKTKNNHGRTNGKCYRTDDLLALYEDRKKLNEYLKHLYDLIEQKIN